MNYTELQYLQSLPLSEKEKISKHQIADFHYRHDGKVYVSFSGGKDSTVLLHLARNLSDAMPAVFVDTGLEYPEIRQFVKTINNVTWLKPKISFHKIIKKYGYPIISKTVSMGFDRYHNTVSNEQKKLRLHGGINPTSGKKQYRSIPKKWHYLTSSGIKFSDRCCAHIKKEPIRLYEVQTQTKGMVGIMADNSIYRQDYYMRKADGSLPIGFWTEKDIWDYIKKYKISYSSIYDMGYDRTGCMFCMFGVHMEEEPNRFQKMKKTHPKHYDLCINKMGCGKILDLIKVKY